MGFIDSMATHWLGCALLLASGVVGLLFGGHLLVDGGVALARRMGLSTLLIGMTVIAFGTSAPELAVNVIAAMDDHTQLSFGNVVGSNIANIGLVLGLAALLFTLPVSGRLLNCELKVLFVITLGVFVLCLMAPSSIPRVAGVVLLVVGVGVVVMWTKLARQDQRDPFVAEAIETMKGRVVSAPRAWILILSGTLLLAMGGKLTEVGGVGVARLAGVSEVVMGLTIVAVATSLPEVVATIVAAKKGQGDLALGNVVGSNFCNLLLVLGVTALIRPVELPGVMSDRWLYLIGMLVLTALLFVVGKFWSRPSKSGRAEICRWEGGGLLVLYAIFLAVVVIRA